MSAIGFINGQQVATDIVSTHGEPEHIQLEVDMKDVLSKESNDVYFVYAEVVDSEGNMVASSTNEIQFELIGDGELLGINPVVAEAGIATILFRDELSSARIEAHSENFKFGIFQ